ncbi:hypothetical protein GBF38_017241, partial [Nibea albiflora]
MVRTSQDYNRPLQRTVDSSEDFNQQTYVVPGQLQSQEEDLSVIADVNGGDREGQGGVDDGEGNGENSQEAFADVLTLEKHEAPV